MSTYRIYAPDKCVLIEATSKREAALIFLAEIRDAADADMIDELENYYDDAIDEVELIEAALPVRYYEGSGAHGGGTVDVFVAEDNYAALEPSQPGSWRLSLDNWTSGCGEGVYLRRHHGSDQQRSVWHKFDLTIGQRFPSREAAITAARRWIDAVRAETDLKGPGGTGLEFQYCPRSDRA